MNVEYERGYNRAKKDFKKKIDEKTKELRDISNLYNKEKEKNKHITKGIVEFVNSHYIHKDKIREKIKELQKLLEE